MRVLIAVDEFTEQHVERIHAAVHNWASVRRIPQSLSPEQYQDEIQDAGIIIGWPDPRWLAGTGVRLVQIGSSGWDAYERQGLEDSGIALCSGRGIHAIGVAEHCIAMMLALARRLPLHIRDKQQRSFCRHPPYAEIAGATACIVGLGRIGAELSRRCAGLQMRVIGVARDASREFPEVEQVFPVSELKTAIAQADHVFMTAPGYAKNRNLFNRNVLEAFSPSAYFYNVSRGSTVDEEALCDLLAVGKIAGAGLDVTFAEPLPVDSPLWNLGDNILITGHSAGLSAGHPGRFCELVIRNLERFHNGEPLENRVF